MRACMSGSDANVGKLFAGRNDMKDMKGNAKRSKRAECRMRRQGCLKSSTSRRSHLHQRSLKRDQILHRARVSGQKITPQGRETLRQVRREL